MKTLFCTISILLISYIINGQTNNKTAEEFYYKGVNKIFRKDYKGAIYDLTEAIRRDSDFLQAYENRGVAKYYLDDNKGAIDDYNKALVINPYDYNTFGRRGWAKFKLNDYEGAMADFTMAIEGKLDVAKYYNTRGQIKYFVGDYKGALADFDEVIKSWGIGREQKSKALFWRGLLKIDTGDNEGGCEDLKKSVKLGYGEAATVKEVYCE